MYSFEHILSFEINRKTKASSCAYYSFTLCPLCLRAYVCVCVRLPSKGSAYIMHRYTDGNEKLINRYNVTRWLDDNVTQLMLMNQLK